METPQASTTTTIAGPVAPAVTSVINAPAPAEAAKPAEPASPAAAGAAADPAKPAEAAAGEAAKPAELAKGFSALAREEQRLRGERDTLKAERQQLIEARDTLVGARGDISKAFALLGYTDEQVLEFIAKGGTTAAAPSADDRVASLEQRIAERDRKDAEARATAENAAKAAAAEQVITTFRSQVTDAITAAGDAYELINAQGEHGEVFARIERHFTKTGELRPFADVAGEVEKELEAKATKAFATKKFAGRATATSEKKNGPPSEQRSTTTTLTNRDSAGGSSELPLKLPLDPVERNEAIKRRRGWA